MARRWNRSSPSAVNASTQSKKPASKSKKVSGTNPLKKQPAGEKTPTKKKNARKEPASATKTSSVINFSKTTQTTQHAPRKQQDDSRKAVSDVLSQTTVPPKRRVSPRAKTVAQQVEAGKQGSNKVKHRGKDQSTTILPWSQSVPQQSRKGSEKNNMLKPQECPRGV